MNDSLKLTLCKEDSEIENNIKSFFSDIASDRVWTVEIDRSIIGGFIVTDKYSIYDYSVKGQLAKISRKLLNNLV